MCLGMVGEDPVPTRFASVAVKQGLQPAVRQNHTDQVNVMAIVVFTHVIPLTYHMLYHSHITCYTTHISHVQYMSRDQVGNCEQAAL